MPISVDPRLPRTVRDSSGNVISEDIRGAAPRKTVDTVGRAWTAPDAAKAAEQAAANNKALPADKKPEGTAEAGSDKTYQGEGSKAEGTEEKAVTSEDVRKEWLQAQKAKREADKMKKEAFEGLNKAKAIEKAMTAYEQGKDPTAILKAAKIDPVKFYQDMTTYALSDAGKEEAKETPEQKQLKEQDERIKAMQEKLEAAEKEKQTAQDNEAHNKVIRESVIPLLEKNADKYETLLMEYGANTAIEVYKWVWEGYQETGIAISFEEACDKLEDFWSKQVETGLTTASKLKKFQSRFAQAPEERRQNTLADRSETSKGSPTLSNKQQSSPIPSVESAPKRRLTREERVQEIVKKHGG